MDNGNNVVYVDLDGTFTKLDMLYESVLVLLAKNPLNVFMLPIWLLRGVAWLKSQIAQRAIPDVSSIPLNPQLLSFLTEQRRLGKRIILATASNERIAQAIVAHYPIFDGYLASTDQVNLKSSRKLESIQAHHKDFIYCGNSRDDIPLFEASAQCVLVNPSSKAVLKRSRPLVTQILDDNQGNAMKLWIKQLRVYQWVKNILVVVPLIAAQAYQDMDLVMLTLMAFFCFSFLASATYIFNDILDVDADRAHPKKRFRPIAHGDISIPVAACVALVLGVIAMVAAYWVSVNFFVVLMGYLGLTLFYSSKLKRYMGMDVVALAGLYTVRVVAGAAVIGVAMSFWLLSFSMFVFFSLAIVKRCSEMKLLLQQGKEAASGRDYNAADYSVFMAFGTASSMMAVLMLCFYMNNDVLENQYQNPQLLWLVIPALVYWMLRVWVKTHRGEMTDDPIVFALKDRGSFILGIITAAIIGSAQVL